MSSLTRRGACAVSFCLLLLRAWAGGSGLNVLLVVNQNSSNSVQLGNYYREKRQVPPQNFLRINWPGGNVSWTNSDFQTYLRTPLISMISTNRLTNQIDYVVLSMDIPYRVESLSNYPNSTTSSLFYGFKPDYNPTYPEVHFCSLATGSSNRYAGSECVFRFTPPISASSNSYLATMITASNLAAAKMVIDQGVISDSTFPTQTVYLGKSTDADRNVRFSLFDNTVFNARLRGNYSIARTNRYDPAPLGYILGYQNGVQLFRVEPTTFAPGAMADNLTSYGGAIFEGTGQTTLFVFLSAGACASYGTVWEPCNYLQKFPAPQNYFYQSRGFSVGECYYQSLTNPYQGMVVGDPLAAPFALPPAGAWSNLPLNSLLSGTTNLSLQYAAADTNHPVGQVDLFLDGLWLQTVTNIAPSPGNALTLTINGHSMTTNVPASATLKSAVSNVVVMLNAGANTSLTKVSAFAHGDRIELQSFDPSKTGSQLTLSVSSSIGTGSALTTWANASGTNFLDTIANGLRGFTLAGNLVGGDYLNLAVTTTNGTLEIFSVTNISGLTLTQLTQSLLDLINTNSSPSLQGPDGLVGEDLVTDFPGPSPPEQVEFNLVAQSPGWAAAGIQVALTASAAITVSPTHTNTLTDNLSDLEPRAHIYVTDGLTNLLLRFPFNTTTQADGIHELTAVVYEGTHVHTEQLVAQTVKIQNSGLSAVFTTLVGDTNTAVEATLQFSVVANTNNISKIELFSTGGSLGSVSGQASATFSVPGPSLDIGLHPFYAVVTRSDGKQYRTETKWIRLVGPDSPFNVSISAPPPALAWPASAGRSYDVLTSSAVAGSYQLSATVVPTNSAAQWTDSNPAPQRFYRVRTSN